MSKFPIFIYILYYIYYIYIVLTGLISGFAEKIFSRFLGNFWTFRGHEKCPKCPRFSKPQYLSGFPLCPFGH